ncbi:Cytochrome c oxidase assembly protein COX11, mitochondrial [Amphibalanus amphitrite]|uniref:Cytochrome c oxidase assembly protein COX11, mitochondrial n=1 Tax=Amphibalanus amphitrite TaxID=1232801 RepID=A0A6A4WLK6_AMPAM|nr:Cytochrome c oxidase assembly protein COX11, mitochondrial [Amphibalanus amphitrite]
MVVSSLLRPLAMAAARPPLCSACRQLLRSGDVTPRQLLLRDVTIRQLTGGGSGQQQRSRRLRSTLYYVTAMGVLVGGLSYAAVPLYRIFCQAYAYGGTTQGHDAEKVLTMKKVEDRELTIRFNADTASSMTWSFRPQQREIKVRPGETALAFYTATNPTDRPIDGIATYNVVPFEAGAYFNKIQCFCFEEQRLNAKEQVDMPVFFYIDPEFDEDPHMENVKEITLSYTFFEAKDSIKMPVPSYATK